MAEPETDVRIAMDQDLHPHVRASPPDWLATLFKTALPALKVDIPAQVLALATQRHVDAGALVCTPDRPLDTLTIVINGNLRLDKNGHTIRNFGAGDYFGEGGLVRDSVPGVAISALEPSDLLEFPHRSLQRVLDAEPGFGVPFMQALLAETMGRLQATNQLFADNRSLAQQLAQTVDRLDGTLAQLQDSEERMRFLASHDPLTELGNRAHLQDQLAATLKQSARTGRRFAVLMIDLDHFKPINDRYGHGAGDAVLRVVARRIAEITRVGDTVARLGGDEFTVVQNLAESESAESIRALAERIIASVSAPITLDAVTCRVGASLGIALYPGDGATVDELMGNADLALYRAKAAGRGGFAFFAPTLGEQALRIAALRTDLGQAAAADQLAVHYLPIADLRSRRITGVEALLRWRHPEFGWIAPEEFLPVAERGGLIGPLGAFVFDQACAGVANWQRARLRIKLTINVSTAQLRVQDIRALLRDAAKRGLSPHDLELDVSEQALADDPEKLMEMLRPLQDLGVSVALDDFGVRATSPSMIKRLGAKTLKIDARLIAGCDTVSDDAEVVRAIVAFGRSLGMRVIAEGVETETQLAALRRMRCDAAQGRLIARALDPAAVVPFLRQHRGGLAVIAPAGRPGT